MRLAMTLNRFASQKERAGILTLPSLFGCSPFAQNIRGE